MPIDSAAALSIAYYDSSSTPVTPTDARRQRVIESALIHIREYERDWNFRVPPTPLYVYLDMTYVPGPAANGGGLFDPNQNYIGSITGDKDELPDLYHEFHHIMLWLTTGNADGAHADPSWTLANRRNDEVAQSIAGSR